MTPVCTFTIENRFCSCALDVTNRRGTYNWPEAVDGQAVSQMCQYGVDDQNVTRYCNEQIWTENISMCPTEVTKQFRQLSSDIKNVGIY